MQQTLVSVHYKHGYLRANYETKGAVKKWWRWYEIKVPCYKAVSVVAMKQRPWNIALRINEKVSPHIIHILFEVPSHVHCLIHRNKMYNHSLVSLIQFPKQSTKDPQPQRM